MTKKLTLIAIALLAIAPFANATSVWFEIDSGSTVAAGSTITINMVADLVTNAYYLDGVVESTSVNANKQALNIVNRGGSVSGIVNKLSNPDSDGPYVDNYQGALFSVNGGYDDPGQAIGTTIMSFNYTISSSWNGSSFWVAPIAKGQTYAYDGGSLTAGQSFADIGQAGRIDVQGVQLQIVPEPITVALMGIGGLFVARKKK